MSTPPMMCGRARLRLHRTSMVVGFVLLGIDGVLLLLPVLFAQSAS
ncbi:MULTISPECIES: hypothetical protein [unclassified Brachybacterium]